MKKRLLSLIMCALMIVSAFVLASCGEDENIDVLGGDSTTKTTSSNTPMTITIYSIRGEGTTDEAIELVENALSQIAIRRYNTTIDLVLIDEEDYASQMFAKVRMAVNSYNTNRLNDKTLDATQKKFIMNSNVDYQYEVSGIKSDYYIKQATNLSSEVLTGELDIFLVYEPKAGIESLYTANAPASAKKYSMFDILYNEGALAPLKSYLTGDYSEVNSVLYSHALEFVTREGYKTSTTQADAQMPKDIFGVPNNYIYGSYEYVIFDTGYVNKLFSGADKQAYADAYSDYEAYVSAYNEYLDSYEQYIEYFAETSDGTSKPKAPVAPYAMVDDYGERYLELKAAYDSAVSELDDGLPTYTGVVSLAPEAPVGRFAELVKELAEKQGKSGFEYDQIVKYFPSENAYETYIESNETFAIGIVAGDKSIEQLFEQHERLDVYISKMNTVTCDATEAEDKDIYCDSMFCIGYPATANGGARAKRCMEILDLLNNNKEFRNIFQYGVEGTHFTQYSDEVIPLESPKAESKYFMDMKYTGNMFILYTSSEMDEAMKLMSKDNWQLAKDQNVELVPRSTS